MDIGIGSWQMAVGSWRRRTADGDPTSVANRPTYRRPLTGRRALQLDRARTLRDKSAYQVNTLLLFESIVERNKSENYLGDITVSCYDRSS